MGLAQLTHMPSSLDMKNFLYRRKLHTNSTNTTLNPGQLCHFCCLTVLGLCCGSPGTVAPSHVKLSS